MLRCCDWSYKDIIELTGELKGTISKYLKKFKDESDVLKYLYSNCGRPKLLNEDDK